MEISLIDRNFRGDESACHGSKPTFFSWDRSDKCDSQYRFITDQCLTRNYDNKKINVAWLLEPRAMSPQIYRYIELNHNKFNCILTYDKQLLNLGNSFLEYVWGSSWISDVVDKEKIENKSKNVSMIASYKRHTDGHRLRHELIKNLSLSSFIDVFGKEYKQFEWEYFRGKVQAYNDYRFSIAMENSQAKGYFTEKIIDCFVSKTVPIYWGDKSIGKYFNSDGIIFFNNEKELKNILSSLTTEKYNKMKDAIEDNFVRAQNFIIPEDRLYKQYPYLFK